MIGEEQLQNMSPNPVHPLGICPDHHPVCDREGARRGQILFSVNLHKAEPASPVRFQVGIRT
jgi:hypothetical protein